MARLGGKNFLDLFDARRDVDGVVTAASCNEDRRTKQGLSRVQIDKKAEGWMEGLVVYPGHYDHAYNIRYEGSAPPVMEQVVWRYNSANGVEVGDSALHVACRHHHLLAVKWLISVGANLARRNGAGLTAYEVADQSGDMEAARRVQMCFPSQYQKLATSLQTVEKAVSPILLKRRSEKGKAEESRRCGQLHGLFEEMDLDHSGFIEAEEVSKLAQTRRDLYHKAGDKTWTDAMNSRLLQKIDTNGDGKIDRDEFANHYVGLFGAHDDSHFNTWFQEFSEVVQRLHGSGSEAKASGQEVAHSTGTLCTLVLTGCT